jgi:putative ABC transport system substrate-binding protein
MRVRGPPVIQSALIGVAASPTGKRFAYPLTYHRQFDTMQSGLAWRDGMQFDQLKRRQFITLVGGAAAWPLAARAQQPERVRRVGVLLPASADDTAFQDRIGAFLQGLQQSGWAIGRNVRIDIRWATNNPAEIRRHAAELAALAPDVVLAFAASTVGAMLQATRSVPIVFPGVADPVAAGFVDSLARPGGNATGFLLFEYGLTGKLLELLKQIAPGVTRVAVLRDPATPAAPPSSVSFRPWRRRSGWR